MMIAQIVFINRKNVQVLAALRQLTKRLLSATKHFIGGVDVPEISRLMKNNYFYILYMCMSLC